MSLDIEGVLAGHVGSERGTHPGPFVVKCRCGDDGTTHRYPGDAWDAHRAHVAAVLREQIAAWLVDEGKREMHERGGHWHTVSASDVHVARKLAALAAQVAPPRVPGEGS